MLSLSDTFDLENIIKTFKPTTRTEQVDTMSAKLALPIDSSDIAQVNAVKPSLSSIIDTVNNAVTAVFRQYLSNQFWKRSDSVQIYMNEGMSITTKWLHQKAVMRNIKNSQIDKKMMRIIIAKEGLSMLKSH
ncbi:MAG: hypothetical protein EXX96DRAFT_539383 [Benjaminiella poitrasii]|nr:MAG: hypothetical protein EXX96DRAFT_539383 [Benjaminiella poitrasii]